MVNADDGGGGHSISPSTLPSFNPQAQNTGMAMWAACRASAHGQDSL